MKKLLPALALAATAVPAHADGYYYDGLKLRQMCHGEQRAAQANTTQERVDAWIDMGGCIGYITGILDGITTSAKPSQSAFFAYRE